MVNFNLIRCKKLAQESISDLSLDLSGMTVLTEAATNLFSLTASLAAIAGAETVLVKAKDSQYGSVDDAIEQTLFVAEQWGCEKAIKVIDNIDDPRLSDVDIITNLSAIRPINSELLDKLKPDAVIPLMFETWEYRDEDIDLQACKERGMLVLGTNEKHPDVDVLSFVGVLALKLILELNVEVYKSKVVILGSGDFSIDAERFLRAAGATVNIINIRKNGEYDACYMKKLLISADVLLMLEHSSRVELIGSNAPIDASEIKRINPGVALIHICGNINIGEIKREGLGIYPDFIAPPGYMSVTTAYAGPMPIIRLHTAGLKVGQIMIDAQKNTKTTDDAIRLALQDPICQGFDGVNFEKRI